MNLSRQEKSTQTRLNELTNAKALFNAAQEFISQPKVNSNNIQIGEEFKQKIDNLANAAGKIDQKAKEEINEAKQAYENALANGNADTNTLALQYINKAKTLSTTAEAFFQNKNKEFNQAEEEYNQKVDALANIGGEFCQRGLKSLSK